MCRACTGGRAVKRTEIVVSTERSGRVPDLPSPRLRAAAAGRHSPLRLKFAHHIDISNIPRKPRYPVHTNVHTGDSEVDASAAHGHAVAAKSTISNHVVRSPPPA